MNRHNLPTQPTLFIGRENEIAEISTLLDDQTCRLLTLVGPGGIGKTRLAIEVAARNADAFTDGVFFVDLQPVSTVDHIVPTIANAIDIKLFGQDEPRAQLLRYLADKHMLLVVDNFEHLLEGTDLLIAILDATSEVQLVVTSRETLNIQAEWLHPVHGLHFSSTVPNPDDETSDAVQLFATRAAQVRRDFSLVDKRRQITRICQLVEGMPLALELAAGWLKTMSCEQVADEIGHCLDFLATSMRDVPSRHRSMWAVFEPTWNRLFDAERDAFMRLCVFHGGFSREAAEKVASVSLTTLSQLVDKSLLHTSATGRYRMHELVRQYGEERLRGVAGAWEDMHDRHSAYYAEFLQCMETDLKGPNQVSALDQIEEEIDNLRAVWFWMVSQRNETQIRQSMYSLALFRAIRKPNDDIPFTVAVARFAGEEALLVAELLLLESHYVAQERERWEKVRKGLSILRALDITGVRTMFVMFLANAGTEKAGSYEDLLQFHRGQVASFKARGEQWDLAWSLLQLGVFLGYSEEYDEAQSLMKESLRMFQALGDRWSSSWPIGALAEMMLTLGRYEDAEPYFAEHLAINREIGDEVGIVWAHAGQGLAASGIGKYHAAIRYICQALELALPVRATRYVTGNLWNIAGVLSKAGQNERAVELIACVQLEPQGLFSTIAPGMLDKLEADLLPDAFIAAKARGEATDIYACADSVLNEFGAKVQTSPHDQPLLVNETLIEPLTERELEVLALIVEGYRNREIADRLYVGVSTVKKHINHIFGKLGVDSRARAIARARELDRL